MASLANLNDKQNMVLTQLSYESDVLKDNYNGMTLEEIAAVVPDTGTRKKLEALCAAGLKDLRIKDVGNDSITGFGAIAFTDENGNTGFSFRGTDGVSWESINDWGDNLATMLTGTSPQTAQAKAFFDLNRDGSGNNYLYGHSKGGELSEAVYVNNYSDIKEVHLLNPQPLNPYSLTADQTIAMQSNKVDIVIVEGDYVWFLGTLPSYGNVRIAKSNGKNSHLYESIEDMFDENGNITPCNQPWWEYAAYFGISLVTTGLQLAGGGIGFVYNCATRVVDFVKNDFIPQAKEFIAWVANGFKKFGEGAKDFFTDLGNFLSDTFNKAKDWYNRNFNAGYKYASANPQISVDTYRLRNYAQRLQSVNRRITNLDGRMDSLYWRVGLLDLWNLMQADILTGYSWRLSRCVSYLNDTASDFEGAESTLINNL